MPCLHVDDHLCLDMSMHWYNLSLLFVCMSSLEVIDDLEGEL
jgi:hypothetical protein